MPLFLGIDDTDSVSGGCTTHIALIILARLAGTATNGLPRLVRLNPNIPWKTRGNGAVAMALTADGGADGELTGQASAVPIVRSSSEDLPSKDDVKDVVSDVFEELARFDSADTHPAFVLSERRPPRSFYVEAVQSVVSLDRAKSLADSIGADYRLYKKGRGLVGALAAMAWTPGDRTYEVITYRRRGLWGHRRKIDEASVVEMDYALPTTFNNYDHLNGKVAIAPNSPCPVLYGIRGDDPEGPLAARSMVRGEEYEDWLLFETNQGTDDHVGAASVNEIAPYRSVRIRATVADSPRDIQGGHVVFSVEDRSGRVDCTAYEPTKQFRNVVRRLLPGDAVEVTGAVRDAPRTINLERLRVLELTSRPVKVANPACPTCGRRMKSAGLDAGYRCRGCHVHLPEAAARWRASPRSLQVGYYEPPVCAMRHISKPLRRMGVPVQPLPRHDNTTAAISPDETSESAEDIGVG